MARATTTTRDVLRALRLYHASENGQRHRWAFLTEVRVGINAMAADRHYARALAKVGADSDWDPRDHADARLDAIALHAEKDWSIVYEVKVDPQDLKRELADSSKRAPALALSNEYFIAAPEGLVEDPDDLPDECGLIEVYAKARGTFTNYHARITRLAPHREIEPLPRAFWMSIALKAS